MPPVPATERTDRFAQLDSLRFFFAVAVVVVHTLGFKPTLLHGGFAVDFFFILSGFVLSHALIRRSVSPVAFAWARLARLYPLHLLTLIWLLGIAGGVKPSEVSVAYSPSAFIFNLTLLQGLGTLGVDTWNFPSWSISVEFLVNLFVLYPIVRTRSMAAAGILIVLSLIAICRLWGPVFDLFNIQRVDGAVLSGGLLRGTAGILLGYLLYEAYLRLRPRIDGARFLGPATICEILTIALLVFCLWIDNLFWNVLPVPLSALLVLQMATVPGHVSRLLQAGIFPLLGNISYSIYLMHIPLFLAVTAVGWLRPPNSGVTWAWLAYFAVVLALSTASFRCIERPAQRAMMRLFRGWSTTAVPA